MNPAPETTPSSTDMGKDSTPPAGTTNENGAVYDPVFGWEMRFSHARLSSTVRPEREKFIISRATEVVTIAATVEISTIWL